MTTLTITNSRDFVTQEFICIHPQKGSYWSVTEWDSIIRWCKDNLDDKGLEWIPIPQKRAIFMNKEAYFMYRLQHGITET
jgi:hypothetical protein